MSLRPRFGGVFVRLGIPAAHVQNSWADSCPDRVVSPLGPLVGSDLGRYSAVEVNDQVGRLDEAAFRRGREVQCVDDPSESSAFGPPDTVPLAPGATPRSAAGTCFKGVLRCYHQGESALLADDVPATRWRSLRRTSAPG